MLTEAVQERATDLAMRTWPHHFDTAALFTVEKGMRGQAQKTLGIGLAVPDNLSDSHYYYINHWSEAGEIDYSELPVLPKGAYWHRGDRVMAILPLSAVTACQSLEEQIQMVRQFFREGIIASQQLLQTLG